MTIGAFANYEYNHPRYVEGMYMFEEYMSVSIGAMVETCKLLATLNHLVQWKLQTP